MKSALCDEGYVWVPKTRDFIENSGKNSEKSKFLVFLRFTVFYWLEFSFSELKLLYATRATRGYQNHGISPDFHVK